jgi:hypothetical protein
LELVLLPAVVELTKPGSSPIPPFIVNIIIRKHETDHKAVAFLSLSSSYSFQMLLDLRIVPSIVYLRSVSLANRWQPVSSKASGKKIIEGTAGAIHEVLDCLHKHMITTINYSAAACVSSC